MSTLRAKYESYLAAPSTGALADNAALHYIPTLTTINEPTAILRHLAAQQKLFKKKSERVLNAIESSNGLCVDTETTIEFIAGGGAILPGLDDNFLADRTVVLPMIHIVQYDANQKIEQIRLYWDQGSLLKQVDVIGARSRNWPIRDGKDQVRLIIRSAIDQNEAVPPPASFSRRSTNSSNEVVVNSRSRGSTNSATGDPHASLSLFAPRDVNVDAEDARSHGPSYARASSAKPPSRDLTDIISQSSEANSRTTNRSRSPSEGGAQKNYGRIRLFDQDEPEHTDSPMKPNAKRYNHFEFGDGEEAAAAAAAKNVKHQSQWNFEDFVTPDKLKPKVRPTDLRTMSWEDPEDDGEKSPVFRQPNHKARPDAETHFEFVDDGTPKADKPKQRTHKDSGLYKDNVMDQDDTKQPLSTITNVSQSDRARDFAPHYEIADNSPSVTRGANGGGPAEPAKKPLDVNKAKVLKGLNSNWNLFEDEAEVAKKENAAPKNKGIKTANDGMGGRKSASRHWGIGDESGDEGDTKAKPQRTGGAKKQEEAKSFWDF